MLPLEYKSTGWKSLQGEEKEGRKEERKRERKKKRRKREKEQQWKQKALSNSHE